MYTTLRWVTLVVGLVRPTVGKRLCRSFGFAHNDNSLALVNSPCTDIRITSLSSHRSTVYRMYKIRPPMTFRVIGREVLKKSTRTHAN